MSSPARRNVRDHLLAVTEAGLVIYAVHRNDPGRRPETFHLGEVGGVADEAKFLRARREEVGLAGSRL